MMNLKFPMILLLICLLAFIPYIQRADLTGADTYYYLSQICSGELEEEESPIFLLLPCNIKFLKFILLLSLFLSSFFVAKIGELYFGKKGLLTGIIIFISPNWIAGFFNFENDQLAYPLIFLSLFLYLKGFKEKNRLYMLSSLAVLAIAGTLWGGAIIYLIGFALLFLPLVLLVIPVVVTYPARFATIFNPSWEIAENLPLIGLGLTTFLLFGLLKPIAELVPFAVLLIIISAMNSKLTILLLPFLALFSFNLIHNLKIKKENMKYIYGVVVFIAFVSMVSFSNAEANDRPNADDWAGINYAIDYSNEHNIRIQNHWDFGYWLEYKGVETHVKGTKIENIFKDSIAIHYTEYGQSNCSALKTFGDVVVSRCS